MFAIDTWWSWLIRAAVLNSLVLLAGLLAISRLRQPAERLRLIQWVMAACLIAPWLPVSSAWRTVSVNLTGRSERSIGPAAISVATPSAASLELPPHAHPTAMPTAPVEERMPVTSAEASGPEAPAERDAIRAFGLPEAVIAAWAVSLLIMTLWGLTGLWLRFSLERRARGASAALTEVFQGIAGPPGKHVRLIVSDAIDSPITWGMLRPVIVVPPRFEGESTDAEVRWGLAHEWSHVKQRDMASLWLAVTVQFVCFYQPLYWVLRRRLILCQDYIADAFAARHSDAPEDYAAYLVRLAKSRLQGVAVLGLGIVDRRSQLFQRIKMLVESRADIRPDCSKRIAVLSACGSLLCLLLLTTIQLDAAGEPQEVKPSAGPPVSRVKEAADEALPQAGVVSGVLIDAANGKPVSEARVLLRSGGLVTTKSDEAGRFRFEKVRPYKQGYELLAHRENLVTGKVLVEQLPGEDATTVKFKPLKLEMKAGKQARFVVTVQGKPIAGAAVRFGYPDRRNVPTGDDGAATVVGLIAQEYDVTVEAEGYARNTPQIDLTQGAAITQYNVALVPGGEVRGVVVDEQGTPLPKAEVHYSESNGNGYHGDAPRTDAEGKFRHRFLPLDVPLQVSISLDGYLPTREAVSLTTGQRSREVRIALQRRPAGGSVAGIVRDAKGNPLSNAQVANYGKGSSKERSATTDAQGRFALHDLLEGYAGIEVWISGKGFSPQRLPVKPGTAAVPAEISVTLEPGHSFRGRVVTEAGKPVPGAHVMVRSGVFRFGMEAQRTDEQGAVAFDSLPADVQVQVSHPEFAYTENMTLPLDGAEPVKIVLEDPGLLRGQVVDATTKQPLMQFRIRLGFCRSRQPGDANGTYKSDWGNPGLTFTAADGRFTIQPLLARTPLELVIEADGYERLVVPRAVAAKAKDAKDLAIALTPSGARAPYSLTVQLLDPAGKPKPNVQLRLIVSTNPPAGRNDNAFNWALIESEQLGQKSYVEQYLPGVTNAEGQFQFKGLLAGKYLQLAYWGEGVPKGRSLAFDETRSGESDRVVIDVPAPAIVRGSVDRSKFPEADAIRVFGAAESFLDFQTKLAGQQSDFELRDLPPGSFWISVMGKPVRVGDGFRTSPLASQRLELKPGDVVEIRFNTPDPPR